MLRPHVAILQNHLITRDRTELRAKAAEADMARLTGQRSAIDQAMFDPASAEPALAKLTMTELMKRRAEIEARIEAAEAEWLEASEALDAFAA